MFFELNPLPSWIYDPKTLAMIEVNEAAVRHYGYTRAEFLALSLDDIRVRKDTSDPAFELVACEQDEWSWRSGPWQHRKKNGALIDVETASRDLSDRERVTIICDVTDQLRAQQARRRSEAKLQEAQEIARLGYWELDTRTGYVSWSPQVSKMLDWKGPSDRIPFGSVLALLHKDDRERVVSNIHRSVDRKEPYDLQFRIVLGGNQIRHVHGRGKLSSGSPHSLAGTILDITELKHTQDALQQSLHEKEVLLKEIHHRVKNNLQVISCLLNIQAESASCKGEAAAAALQDSERRVISMALIHERLYGSSLVNRIDFADYTRTLVEDLLATCISGAHVSASFSLKPVHLSVEQAIPCGLILNELVTNALKHAYPRGSEGEIRIELFESGSGLVTLSISDKGRGMPPAFDLPSSASLGLTIVNLLSKQIGGSFRVVPSNPGSSFQITFRKLIESSCR